MATWFVAGAGSGSIHCGRIATPQAYCESSTEGLVADPWHPLHLLTITTCRSSAARIPTSGCPGELAHPEAAHRPDNLSQVMCEFDQRQLDWLTFRP